MPAWLGTALIVLAGIGLYLWYAQIIARRNKVLEALSSVDVHLNQRHDLIPNIVKLADRFMAHERALLTEVTRLRQAATQPRGAAPEAIRDRFGLEGQLAQHVGQVLLTMEAYPELTSQQTVQEAQRSWSETEAQITAARRFYNAAVNQLNTSVQLFPGSLLARLAGVRPMPFFEAPAAARTAPDLDRLLGPGARPD